MVKNLGFSDFFSYWGSTRGVGVELTGDRINIAQLHRVRQGLRIELSFDTREPFLWLAL